MDNLRKLQLEELALLKDFVEFCDKNNYKYFLLGGTLLGAIRHQGFIPWDDDIDVCMPREDFNKFMSTYTSKNGYRLVNYDTDKHYRYSWPRIESSRLKIINHSANKPREENAWIDIIPLDGFPDKGIEQTIHKAKLMFWWNLNQILQFDELVDQKRKRSLLSSLSVKFASLFKWLKYVINYKTCLAKLNQTLEKYPYYMDSQEIINFLASDGFTEVFPRSAFAKDIKLLFEGDYYNSPAGYDAVCRAIYGDNYMELPPEDQRNKHNSTIIEGDEE